MSGEVLGLDGQPIHIQKNDFESIISDWEEVFKSGTPGQMFIYEKHQDKVYSRTGEKEVKCVATNIDPYDGLKLATAHNTMPVFVEAFKMAMKSIKESDSVLYGQILATLQPE